MERPDWLDDPRFTTQSLRQEHIDARLSLTQEVLKTRTAAEWLTRLDAEDVPCAPVLRRRDVIDHPQLLANETVTETDHPIAGRLRQARPAARFSATPVEHRHGGSLLGQHSQEILRDAGFDEREIETLMADAVIAQAEERSA